MAYVRTIEPDEAEGEILEAYQKMTGQERPERMANVMKSTSLRPRTLLAMSRLNTAVNFDNDDSGVTRLQREMIAAVVSATMKCRY
jgi:alkylhydroperoxidase family enzyme